MNDHVMIGVFAKMFRADEQVTEITEAEHGLEVKARRPADVESQMVAVDEPPAAFAEEVRYEGGSLYVIPFMEAFRNWTRKLKSEKE